MLPGQIRMEQCEDEREQERRPLDSVSEDSQLLGDERDCATKKDGDYTGGESGHAAPTRSWSASATYGASGLFAVCVIASVLLLAVTGMELLHVSHEQILDDLVIRKINARVLTDSVDVHLQIKDKTLMQYNAVHLDAATCDVRWKEDQSSSTDVLGSMAMKPTILANGNLFNGLLSPAGQPMFHHKNGLREATVRLTDVDDALVRRFVKATLDDEPSSVKLTCNAEVSSNLWGWVPMGTTYLQRSFTFPIRQSSSGNQEEGRTPAAATRTDASAVEGRALQQEPLEHTARTVSGGAASHMTDADADMDDALPSNYIWVSDVQQSSATVAVDLGKLKRRLNLAKLVPSALESVTIRIPNMRYEAGAKLAVEDEAAKSGILSTKTGTTLKAATWNVLVPAVSTQLILPADMEPATTPTAAMGTADHGSLGHEHSEEEANVDEEVVFIDVSCLGSDSETSWVRGLRNSVQDQSEIELDSCSLSSPVATAAAVFAQDQEVSVVLKAVTSEGREIATLERQRHSGLDAATDTDGHIVEQPNILQRVLGVVHEAKAHIAHDRTASLLTHPSQLASPQRRLGINEELEEELEEQIDERVSEQDASTGFTCLEINVDNTWNSSACYRLREDSFYLDADVSEDEELIGQSESAIWWNGEGDTLSATAISEGWVDNDGRSSYTFDGALDNNEKALAALLSTRSTRNRDTELEASWKFSTSDGTYLEGDSSVVSTDVDTAELSFNVSSRFVYTDDDERTPDGTDGYLELTFADVESSYVWLGDDADDSMNMTSSNMTSSNTTWTSSSNTTWSNTTWTNSSNSNATDDDGFRIVQVWTPRAEGLLSLEWDMSDGMEVELWSAYEDDGEYEEVPLAAYGIFEYEEEEQSVVTQLTLGTGMREDDSESEDDEWSNATSQNSWNSSDVTKLSWETKWFLLTGASAWTFEKEAGEEDHTLTSVSSVSVDYEDTTVLNGTVTIQGSLDDDCYDGDITVTVEDWDSDDDERLNLLMYTRWDDDDGFDVTHWTTAEWERESVFAVLSATEYVSDADTVMSSLQVGTVSHWWMVWSNETDSEAEPVVYWDDEWLKSEVEAKWEYTLIDEDSVDDEEEEGEEEEGEDEGSYLLAHTKMYLDVEEDQWFNVTGRLVYTDDEARTPDDTDGYVEVTVLDMEASEELVWSSADNGTWEYRTTWESEFEALMTFEWEMEDGLETELWASFQHYDDGMPTAFYATAKHTLSEDVLDAALVVGRGEQERRNSSRRVVWEDEWLSLVDATHWVHNPNPEKGNATVRSLSYVVLEVNEERVSNTTVYTSFFDEESSVPQGRDAALWVFALDEEAAQDQPFYVGSEGEVGEGFWATLYTDWGCESNIFELSMESQSAFDNKLMVNATGEMFMNMSDEFVRITVADYYDGEQMMTLQTDAAFNTDEEDTVSIALFGEQIMSFGVPSVEGVTTVLVFDNEEILDVETGTIPEDATRSPTLAPSRSPTRTPTLAPSDAPSTSPTVSPSALPTLVPSLAPSTAPTAWPTDMPSGSPTPEPTQTPTTPVPTTIPTTHPTPAPTVYPTAYPSWSPTLYPTEGPTTPGPTDVPSVVPTIAPSGSPTTGTPTSFPTEYPSQAPTTPFPTSIAPTTGAPTGEGHTPYPSSMPTAYPTTVPTSVPTPAPTQIMYPILDYPIVADADVDEVSVTVEIDRAGRVFCALFTEDNSADVTSSEIEVDAQSATLAKEAPGTLTFVGLDPLTLFYGACFARDTSGTFSTPNSAIQSWYTFNVTTTCCRGVRLSRPSVWMYESETSDEFTLTLESKPSSSVTLNVSVYENPASGQCDGSAPQVLSGVTLGTDWTTSTTLTAQPAVFTVTSTSSVLDMDFVLVADSVSSSECHAIAVSISGDSAAEFDTVDDSIMSVLDTTAEPIAPLMSTALFDTTGSLITVTFDSDTDRAGETGSFDCETIFWFTSVASASCLWSSDSELVITLDSTASNLPAVGDNITMFNETLKAYCSADPVSECDDWGYTSAHQVTIAEPETPVVPIPIISGPEDISTCDEAEWDMFLSENSGGREFTSIEWSIGILGATDANFTASDRDSISISTGDLGAREYVVTLTVENFFGRSATTTLFVSVSSIPKPSVVIVGGSSQTFNAFDDVVVEANGAPPDATSCSVNASSLAFEWEFVDSDFESSSVNPRVLLVSAGRLTPGASYQAQVTVSMDAGVLGTITNTALVTIKIAQSDLVAIITDRGATATVTSALVLDGSGSYDPDFESRGTNGLSFEWECMEISPSFGDDCFDTTGVTLDSDSLRVGPGRLQADEVWRFTLVVSDTDDADRESSTDQFTITLGTQDCPSQDITQSSAIHNVGTNVRLTATLTAVHESTSYMTYNWTLESGELVGSSSLAHAVTTSVDGTVSSTSGLAILNIDGDYTLPGVTYTLNMAVQSFDSSGNSLDTECYAPVDVETNRPPTPGSMTISPPDNATIGETVISLQALSFSDVHTPFRYRWSTDDGISTRVLSAFSRDSSLDFVWYSEPFPVPSAENATEVTIYLTVQDSLGATTTVSNTYNLFAGSDDLDTLGDTVNERTTAALQNKDPNQVNEVLAAGGRLRSGNCRSSCTRVQNREACSSIVGLCGNCLAGYSGPRGPSTGRCTVGSTTRQGGVDRRRSLSVAPLASLYGVTNRLRSSVAPAERLSMMAPLHNNRRLAEDCPDPTGIDGDCGGSGVNCTRCGLNDTCDADSDCDSGYCDAGRCAIPSRSCPNSCSDNGTCTGYDIHTGETIPMSECLVTNTECRAFCDCDTGSYGEQCSLTAAGFSAQQDFVHTMIVAAQTSESLTDSSASEVDIVLGALEDSTSKPHLLLWSDLADVMQMVVNVLEYYVDNDGYTSTIATSALTVGSNVLTRVLLGVIDGDVTRAEVAANVDLMNATQQLATVAASAMSETALLGEDFGDIEYDLLLGTFGVLSATSGNSVSFSLPVTDDEEWFLGATESDTQVTFLDSYLSTCDADNDDGFFVFATRSFLGARASGLKSSTLGTTLRFGRAETGLYLGEEVQDGDGVGDVEITLTQYDVGENETLLYPASSVVVECKAGEAELVDVTCPGVASNETVNCTGAPEAYNVNVTCGAVTRGSRCVVWTGEEFDADLCWQVSTTTYSTTCRCDLFTSDCQPVAAAFSLLTNSTGLPSTFESAAATATTADDNIVTQYTPTAAAEDDEDDKTGDGAVAMWVVFVAGVIALVVIGVFIVSLVKKPREEFPGEDIAAGEEEVFWGSEPRDPANMPNPAAMSAAEAHQAMHRAYKPQPIPAPQATTQAPRYDDPTRAADADDDRVEFQQNPYYTQQNQQRRQQQQQQQAQYEQHEHYDPYQGRAQQGDHHHQENPFYQQRASPRHGQQQQRQQPRYEESDYHEAQRQHRYQEQYGYTAPQQQQQQQQPQQQQPQPQRQSSRRGNYGHYSFEPDNTTDHSYQRTPSGRNFYGANDIDPTPPARGGGGFASTGMAPRRDSGSHTRTL